MWIQESDGVRLQPTSSATCWTVASAPAVIRALAFGRELSKATQPFLREGAAVKEVAEQTGIMSELTGSWSEALISDLAAVVEPKRDIK